MDNLALIRSLERASGRRTQFVNISGFANLQGKAAPGNGWDYSFGTLDDNVEHLYAWRVDDTGRVVYFGEIFDTAHLDIVEIGTALAVDSPEAVQLALGYGGQAFVDRYPKTTAIMNCRYRGGHVVWEVFFDALTVGGPVCFLGPIVVDARTGALLYRDLSCPISD